MISPPEILRKTRRNSFAPSRGPGLACLHTSRAAAIRAPVNGSRAGKGVPPVETYLTQRPSGQTSVCALVPPVAPVHASVVGQLGVWRALPVNHHESVQSIRAQVTGMRDVQLLLALTPDQGTSGFVAKTSGMAKAARKGGTASGIPPRGRPV